jgi:hypothetical protein
MRAHIFSAKRVSKEYKRFPHPGYCVTKKTLDLKIISDCLPQTLILFKPAPIYQTRRVEINEIIK